MNSCRKCQPKDSVGFETNTPCGEPFFAPMQMFKPEDEDATCRKPWADDMFQVIPYNYYDSNRKC